MAIHHRAVFAGKVSAYASIVKHITGQDPANYDRIELEAHLEGF